MVVFMVDQANKYTIHTHKLSLIQAGSASLSEWLQEFNEIVYINVLCKLWSTVWMLADSIVNSSSPCSSQLLEGSILGPELNDMVE